MAKNSRNRYVWIVVALLAAGFLLRMLNLGKEFSGDESILIEISRHDAAQIVPQLTTTDIYPPLTYLAVHYLMKVAGSDAFIRLYFVLFGIGACWLVYLIAKEYCDEKLAVIALLLAAFSPLMIFTSQYVRSYIDSAFWMLLSVFFMLKILKGSSGIANWVGYALSMALSLYTFYFSALLFFAQCIFMTVFALKERKIPWRWYSAFFIAGLAFLPWAPTALRQFHNASSLVYDWASKGLCIGPFRVGLYVRNVLSLIGFDPYFMVFNNGVVNLFSKSLLLIAVILAMAGFIFFMQYCFRSTKEALLGDEKLTLFLPCLIFVPLVMTWILSGVLNMLPFAKYFVAFHALFLIMIAAAIRRLLVSNRVLGIAILIIIVAVFSARIPQAVASEFGTKDALMFLKSNMASGDCLVCARYCPDSANFPAIVRTDTYFKLNDKGSAYIWVSPEGPDALKGAIAPFKKIWFYRVYGNAEIFGLNKLLDKAIREGGYEETKTARYNSIDVVKYEKQDDE